jgi:hypothetical protein
MTSREEELLRRVEGLIAETRRDAERVARQDAPREAERAQAARRGELGSDWQSVQRRVDAGETTLAEVFGGTDHSPAAVRLRGRSQVALETVGLPDDLAAELAALRQALP